jgi:hypothetical protein
MRLPFPNQISSVPEIDQQALAWSQLLVDGLGKLRISELAFGQGIVTWPGASIFSNVLQVTHGLSKQATALGAVFTQINDLAIPGLNEVPVVGVHAGLSAQQFAVQMSTVDAQQPANTATCTFYWLAIL